MVAGGLMAIFFVCTLAVFAVWSIIFSLFTAHYFLTTLTDSSSGLDEVQYPRESMFDWWWKPILLAWMLIVWVVPASMLFTPIIMLSPTAFAIIWIASVWCLYPLGLASSLYSQNWLHFIHFEVVGRMFRHLPALIYVHVVTFAMFFASMWLIGRIIENGLMWVLPAAVVVSFSLLLYARHWGRFAWLSLNFLPRYLRGTQLAKPKAEAATEAPPPAPLPKEAAPKKIPVPKPNPEPEAEAVAASVLNEGVREGLPPQYATGIQTATPGTPQSVVAGPPPASPVPVDEFTYDPAPYEVADVPGLPTFAEAAAPAPMPVAAATTAPIATVEEEEDEWSTNKKPYDVGAPVVPLPKSDVPPPEPTETDEDLNAPVTLSQYYDDKAEKDAEEARRREEEKRKMPPLSKKTPTFVKALITGVWNFVVYPSTLVAWLNLAVITFVELFIFWMLVMFNPFKGGGGN